MKAKVKETGEIVDIDKNYSIIEYIRNIYTDKSTQKKYQEKELEFIQEPSNDINWEQRRYEIAKVMLSAVFESKDSYGYRITLKEAATEAVSYADALIEELKKTK